jgi:hypothetical protein
MLFLVEYDPPSGRTISMIRYADSELDLASEARRELELELNRRGVLHEVVLLEAASEAALRKTHARYFEGLKEMYSRFERSTGAFVVRETKD